MKYTDILNHPSFQNIAAVIRVPFRSAYWRQQHPDVPFWTLLDDLTKLPGGPTHPNWLSRWTELQVALAEADSSLVLSTEDVSWLLAWTEYKPADEAIAVVAMLYAYASAPDETLTPAEIAAATGTAESTWRNKAAAGEIAGAVKRGKQWLIPERVLIDAVTSGMVQPASSLTAGTTWYYQNETEPLIELGRVPLKTGMHVLRRQDGSLAAIGGYYLRRDGEIWDDADLA